MSAREVALLHSPSDYRCAENALREKIFRKIFAREERARGLSHERTAERDHAARERWRELVRAHDDERSFVIVSVWFLERGVN